MKTCYGGYCYDQGESKVDPSFRKAALVAVAIAVILVAAVAMSNDNSLGNYLSNGDFSIP